MTISKTLGLLLLLLVPGLTHAQTTGTCWVTGSWFDTQEKIGSGILLLGKLNPSPNKGANVTTYKAYGDLVVTINVDYGFAFKKSKPHFTEIRIGIAASNAPGAVLFGLANTSQATTAWKNGWNLTSSTTVNRESKSYTFTLACADSSRRPKS